MPSKNNRPNAEAIVIELPQVPTVLLNLMNVLGAKLGPCDEAEHAAADDDHSQDHQGEKSDPSGAEVPKEPSKPAEGHTAPEDETSGHEPGCPMLHVEERRQRAWAICDEAFPHEPHLWSALEMLLLTSENFNPSNRSMHLAEAVTHIEHHLQTVPETVPTPFGGIAAFIDRLGK